MNTADDTDWLDALAGRRPGATGAAREGARLRSALRQRRSEVPDSVPATSMQREDELLARARREGLLTRPRPGWGRDRWLALAASLAVVSIGSGLGWYLLYQPQPEIVRSVDDGLVRIEAGDPAREQQVLLAALREAGVAARGYEMLGRYGVDADLPAPVPPQVLAVLERYRLPVTDDGVLRVEFTERAAR